MVQTYEELVAAYGKLPNAFLSFAPILVPIILMGVASALSMAKITVPVIALAVGVIISIVLLAITGKMGEFYAITDETLKTVGPILFVTAAASIVAPMLPQLGLDSPARAALTVIAIGAGAMTVSHANDSYFWVVTNFGDMEVEDGYKTQTLGTLVIGVASMVGVLIVSLFLR